MLGPSRPDQRHPVKAGESLDPRILRIAEAIGRQLARELARPPATVNDNERWPR
jgi:hypothetical protein